MTAGLSGEVARRLAAADAVAADARQRLYEVRAEAALLLESVEDRAVEEVEAAQAATEAARREVEALRAELASLRRAG